MEDPRVKIRVVSETAGHLWLISYSQRPRCPLKSTKKKRQKYTQFDKLLVFYITGMYHCHNDNAIRSYNKIVNLLIFAQQCHCITQVC